MISGLYLSASAMMTHLESQSVYAENMSASVSPGHYRRVPTFEAALQSVTGKVNRAEDLARSTAGLSADGASFPKLRLTTDFTPGQLIPDGNPNHLGIDGAGFFALQSPDGKSTVYTRYGAFRVGSKGDLTTLDGWKVLNTSNSPIKLANPTSPMVVSGKGEVTQDQIPAGRIKVVEFKNPAEDLVWMGGGYYVPAKQGVRPADMESPSVQQGTLEMSNVNSIREMVEMVEGMRMYEANRKMVEVQDESIGQVINKVPRT